MSQPYFHSHTGNRLQVQTLSDYSVIDIINYGSFGICYKVKLKSLKELYVWKAIDFGAMSNHDKQELLADIKIMDSNTMIHSNIVRYNGTIIHEDSGTLYAIMEYCHCGDLDSLMNSYKLNQQLMNEKFIWKVLYQLSKAIAAFHRTISYLNIKPANIFLDKHYNLKLADSRLQKILIKSITFSATIDNIHYPSPEQINGIINQKTDVWAVGCLIYELCALEISFVVESINRLKLTTQKIKLPKLPTFYSENLNKIIKLLMNVDEHLRPSVETIIHHPTVICNYDRNATPFHGINLKSKCEKTKTIPSSAKHYQEKKLNGEIEVIQSGDQYSRPQSSLYYDPRKITEEVYNEKFFNRLKLLRVKETALKVKENDLKSKEFYLNTFESNLVHKQKLIEKREREMNVVQDEMKKKTNTCDKVVFKTYNKYKTKQNEKCADLESTTCSADPGDMSVMPTAVKLDPSKIVKPPCFQTKSELTNNDKCIEQKCIDEHTIANLPNHHLKRSKSCSTLKKCKQLIMKK